ncbi:MAG: hypothetical protein PHG49_03245 [Candidatus Pacebacteria bacterium]|nr:hypothetical protein [Candidatus Paceibacterota bacterium]
MLFNFFANSIVKIPDPDPKSATDIPSQTGILFNIFSKLTNCSIYNIYMYT